MDMNVDREVSVEKEVAHDEDSDESQIEDEDIELDDDLGNYEVYEPFLSGIRLTSGIRAWLTVALLYRRIILIIVAMALFNFVWIQVLIFVFCSLFMCFVLVIYRPYCSMVTNRFELFNESMILTVGYLAMTIVGFMRSPIESDACGVCMIWVIRIHIALNIVYILYGILRTILLYYKRYMYRRAAKRSLAKKKEMARQVVQLGFPLSSIEEESKENQNVVDEES